MNRLVNKIERYTWSEQCKELLGKYVEFYTINKNYICGFVISYTDDSEGGSTMKIGDQFGMVEVVIKPNDLLFVANCTVYNLSIGTKSTPLKPVEVHQGSLVRKDAVYEFDYIDESRVYSFVDKKSGCLIFLTFSDVTKDKATVRMAGGFCEKEFTAKEFAETFDDDEERGYCGCPCRERYLKEDSSID